MSLAVLVSRLPAIFCDLELNVDESQWMAESMRYLQDFVPWRSVDSTTCGPLIPWLLSLMQVLGVQLTYSNVHLLATFVLLAAVIMTWTTMRQFSSPAIAAAGGIAATAFVVLAQGSNYTQFASELIPAALISGAMMLIARGLYCQKARVWTWGVACALLGAAPWGKLQTVPISMAVFSCLFWMTWRLDRQNANPPWKRLKNLALLVAGFVLVSAVIFSVLVAHGVFREFWDSYIMRNLGYAGDGRGRLSLGSRLARLWFSQGMGQIGAMQSGASVFLLAWICLGRPGWNVAPAPLRAFFTVCLVCALSALAVVITPPNAFPHYEYLAFIPVTLLATATLAIWRGAPETAGANLLAKLRRASLALFTVTMIGFQLFGINRSVANAYSIVKEGKDHGSNDTPRIDARIGARIRAVSPQAQSLGVWGWAPAVNVYSGLTPATRYSISHYLIDSHPLRARFRQIYLKDMKRSQPDVFVDAVAPGCFTWRWGSDHGIESFPKLNEFITKNYYLAAEEKESELAKPVRIYVKNGARQASEDAAARKDSQ